MSIAHRMADLGLTLPAPITPIASFVPFTRVGGLLFLAGQISMRDGKPALLGRIGDDLSINDGRDAARLCALGLMAQINLACDGDLERVRRVARLGGFVHAVPGFTDHSAVIDGASALFLQVFGDSVGAHARTAVGVASLPRGAAVEVDAIVEVDV